MARLDPDHDARPLLQGSHEQVTISSALLLTVALASCSKGPCPRGQELREERSSSGKVKSRGCVGQDKEGSYRLQGKWEYFWKNGQKFAEGAFKDGVIEDLHADSSGRTGLWTLWHKNGQKFSEKTYKDGKLEGLATEWHDNGQKMSEGTYQGGKREGLWTFWGENGQKESEVRYKDGEEVE